MKFTEVAVCIALAVFAVGCSSTDSSGMGYGEMGSDRFGPIPAPDPGRRISWQNCTEPLDEDGGNLMCR